MNQIIQGDCREQLKTLPDNSVDAIITDPPYELGFMGKSWDASGIAYNVDLWKECLRVLKPGGHLLAFSGTRTYHRMTCAIEDAGFEVRDFITWAYGQGFPKSLNVFKQIKKKCTCGNMEEYERRVQQEGQDSAKEAEHFLRLMWEANIQETINIKEEQGKVLQSEMSEQNIYRAMQGQKSKEGIEDGKEPCVEGRDYIQETKGELQWSSVCEVSRGVSCDGEEGWICDGAQTCNGSTHELNINQNSSGTPQRPQSKQQPYKQPCPFCKQWGAQAIRTIGVGSGLKPSIEPICMARKPIEKGLTIAENCLKWGVGGINIDGCRVGIDKDDDIHAKNPHTVHIKSNLEFTSSNGEAYKVPTGRFPANLIHDNSEEVRACFPETKSGGSGTSNSNNKGIWGNANRVANEEILPSSGNASRFFKSIIYTAKASKSERGKENNHPTVKPVALMEYLIDMVSNPGYTILDPFMGSGTTGVACKKLGRKFIGIELDAEYIKIAECRIGAVDTGLFGVSHDR